MTKNSDNILMVSPGSWDDHKAALTIYDKEYVCALGKRGVTENKQEGDQKTPLGDFPLRNLFYRPDYYAEAPVTSLMSHALHEEDGWCDDPADVMYNRPVKHPYPSSAERLWRDDHVYNLIVPLGYNDSPPLPGRGSAIFMHIARENFSGTAGCIVLSEHDLIEILAQVDDKTILRVLPPK